LGKENKFKRIDNLKAVYEGRLNVLLSELLGKRGLVSRSEVLGSGRKDIVVYHKGFQIVLEGSYSMKDAEKDARKRLEQMCVDLAIAVYYPEKISQDLSEVEIKEKLEKAEYYIKVLTPAKEFEWIKVKLDSFGSVVREAVQFLISEKYIKEMEKKIDSFIQQFVTVLKTHPKSKTINQNLCRILFQLYGFSIGNPDEISEVIFAQTGLALLLSSVYYETIRYIYMKQPLSQLGYKLGPKGALEKAFDEILKINYEPIFKTAKNLLQALPSLHIYKDLVKLAVEIAQKRTLLKRDFIGRIYHKIVGSWQLRKGLATYFTSVPSAYLLSYLANPKPKLICDFACGSGTLLTATYSVVRRNFASSLLAFSELPPKELDGLFHKKFIENCYAFDVLKYATQITALNLAFNSPETPVKTFNTFTLPLGVKNGKVSLGSLDFLRQPLVSQFAGENRVERVVKVTFEEEKEVTITVPQFDFIIMNPPFTRCGGKKGKKLFGFLPDEKVRIRVLEEFKALRDDVRNRLKQKVPPTYRKFLQKYSSFESIGQAGEGLLFLCLAHKMLKDGGKLCFVLPKSFLTGVSWFLVRSLLLSDCNFEYIVVSYDPEGSNFSESTSLSECLIIARKTDKENKTKFVILLKKPKTSTEAIALASLIREGNTFVQVGNATAFVVEVSKQDLLNSLDTWGIFCFLPSPVLINTTKQILQGKIMGSTVPLTKLENLADSIGIGRSEFNKKSNFKMFVKSSVPNSVEVLHGGSEEIRKKMSTEPNAYAVYTPRGLRIFNTYSGRLLVPGKIRLNTAHIVSMLSSKPTISNLFYAVKLKNETEEKLKALCVWFNSVFGFLTVLARREETEGLWIEITISQWKLMPALDVSKLPDDVLKRLADVYDKYRNRDFGKLTEQFNESRLDFDRDFLKALGISFSDDELKELYREINLALKIWGGERT